MYIVILSGGSGTRLWPLSVAGRAKQFIPIFDSPDAQEPLSMLQLAWRGLAATGLAPHCLICAGENQVAEINQQISSAQVITEPFSHDTFAAIALACSYIYSVLQRPQEEVVCFIPVDTCAAPTYYELINRLPVYLKSSGADIILMGVQPDSPSSSYGYLVPQSPAEPQLKPTGEVSPTLHGWQRVQRFVEKPDPPLAAELLAAGALWNAGVFCFRLEFMLTALQARALPDTYARLRQVYGLLPQQSFDYEVLQQQPALAVAPYGGAWADAGSWQSVRKFYRHLHEPAAKKTADPDRSDPDRGAESALVINQTHIPVIMNHVHDLLLVASYDGILITDSPDDSKLKACVRQLPARPTFTQATWGSSTVIYNSQAAPTAQIQSGQLSWTHCPPPAGPPDLAPRGYVLRLLKIKPLHLVQAYADNATAATVLVLKGQIQFWEGRASILLRPGETHGFTAGCLPDLSSGQVGAELLLFQGYA